MSENSKYNVPINSDTSALMCSRCNAVSFTTDGICEIQGKVKKGDWCGLKHDYGTSSLLHNERYQCAKCGQVSVNPELLCEPGKFRS